MILLKIILFFFLLVAFLLLNKKDENYSLVDYFIIYSINLCIILIAYIVLFNL
jgi:hypothetical protein